MGGRLHIVGVRHHSPACARVAESVIRAVRPAFVLIEGPSDMNDRLDELDLDHDPPIALFSFLRDSGPDTSTDRASWYPLCSYSPEWVSLRVARDVGANVKFMDLPGWSRAFGDRINLAADGADRYSALIDALCKRTGAVGLDALWDHLFEGVDDVPLLLAAFDAYFDELRALGDAAPGDLDREEHMRAWVAAALAHSGDRDVVVVCGGFHRPALQIADRPSPQPSPQPGPQPGQPGAASVDWPVVPVPETVRAETYLVPYSFERLDSFTGYQSGMASPGFYDLLYEHGPRSAIDEMLRRVVTELRQERQTVSTADLVALTAVVDGLARIRGHQVPLRVDLLDGIATALLKSASDTPLPWETRGPLHARTHPLLRRVMHTLRGERVGTLDPETPRPPLLHDAMHELEAVGITPTSRATPLNIDRTKPLDVRRASVLHRLQLLSVPGFTRIGHGLSVDETWTIEYVLERDVALIEASIYGPTLATAAAGKATQRLQAAAAAQSSLDGSLVLLDCILASLDALTVEAIRLTEAVVESDSDIARLAKTLGVFALLLGDADLANPFAAAAGNPSTGALFSQLVGLGERAVERFLWLVEQLAGGSKSGDSEIIAGVAAAVEVVRRIDATQHSSKSSLLVLVEDVFRRRIADSSCPVGVRGACLGSLWSLGLLDDGAVVALRAFSSIGLDEHPGDLLAGLFATARREFAQEPELLAAVDEYVTSLTADEFLKMLPGLRQAFGWFPARERAQLGTSVAQLHGLSTATRMVMNLGEDPIAKAAALAFDERVRERLNRFGLVLPRGAA